MEQALKFEEEFSIRCFLHETRLPRATAKRSSIYYYSKDAEDEEEEGEENGRRSKRRRRCIREESWRNNLTSSLYSLYSFPSTARTLLTTISSRNVIHLSSNKERKERLLLLSLSKSTIILLFYFSFSFFLFPFFARTLPQSRSNLYTGDCQKQGKHATRGSRLN